MVGMIRQWMTDGGKSSLGFEWEARETDQPRRLFVTCQGSLPEGRGNLPKLVPRVRATRSSFLQSRTTSTGGKLLY